MIVSRLYIISVLRRLQNGAVGQAPSVQVQASLAGTKPVPQPRHTAVRGPGGHGGSHEDTQEN